jgi:hypothetical protein
MQRRDFLRFALGAAPKLWRCGAAFGLPVLEERDPARSIDVYLTEYYPFLPNMTPTQRKMEGGVTDREGNPLHSLDEFLDGKAPFASLACDYKGGPPAREPAFRIYGCRVIIPAVDKAVGRHVAFELVDTGSFFYGRNKLIRIPGHEPIDICRTAPRAHGLSFDGAATLIVG